MAVKSKIQWTEATWNPWHGCKKVSPGCKFCYMYRDKERYNQDPTTVLRSKTKFNDPLKWEYPMTIFTCSWSDWFIEEADKWRDEAWEIIRKTPQHTYQILTKRPERIHENLPRWFSALDNVWIGVSIESQTQVDRLSYLVDLDCITFASFEPLIGPIEWHEFMGCLDWCIIGGESGNSSGKYRYRPCAISWIERIKTDFAQQDIPVFIKQLGTYLSDHLGLKDRHGGNMEEWPNKLRIREMPK